MESIGSSSSTAATYGLLETVPITEDEPNRPINPYGHSKPMVEQMLYDFAAAHRLRSAIMLYFNAAGASSDGEIGEAHLETHLIPLSLDGVAGKGPPLTIFGEDYPPPDGTCIRDYMHVGDLTDAHILALDWLSEPGGEAIGSSTSASALASASARSSTRSSG